MATINLRMAKATLEDVNAAFAISNVIEDLHKGYHPCPADDTTTFFDEDDPEHLRALYDRLIAITERGGSLYRVAGGMHVILTNDVLDPDDDCIALHPRFQKLATVDPQDKKEAEA